MRVLSLSASKSRLAFDVPFPFAFSLLLLLDAAADPEAEAEGTGVEEEGVPGVAGERDALPVPSSATLAQLSRQGASSLFFSFSFFVVPFPLVLWLPLAPAWELELPPAAARCFSISTFHPPTRSFAAWLSALSAWFRSLPTAWPILVACPVTASASALLPLFASAPPGAAPAESRAALTRISSSVGTTPAFSPLSSARQSSSRLSASALESASRCCVTCACESGIAAQHGTSRRQRGEGDAAVGREDAADGASGATRMWRS